ncbi:MAG: hypothetical protein H6R40_235 [Gemmatimonadetes bacterium]|nr:hypothetical protein [Gemmatimonadota bacterium]
MTDRRAFLAAFAAVPVMAHLPHDPPGVARGRAASSEWDMSWLDRLTGRHKQVFDVESLAIPLIVVANYLRGFREVMNLEYPDVNTVVGLAGGYGVNANDAMWARYKLGERYQIKDPDTGTWAVRNPFALRDPMPKGINPEHTVQSLQKRGTIFWQCNNALNAMAGGLAAANSLPVADVRKEMIDNMLPGVILVPAHTMLLGLCQERGCTYEKL